MASVETMNLWWDGLLYRLDKQGGASASAADRLRGMPVAERQAVLSELARMSEAA